MNLTEVGAASQGAPPDPSSECRSPEEGPCRSGPCVPKRGAFLCGVPVSAVL
ncbi:zinc finger protein 17 [Homo sapiens]|uniref:Zinc finger protein 17 n=1 Tax=Homo sapiens TaxID=9606 RepID=M0QZR3_HUMAN|nr:zinc finger protein 17 [Homo sapiens]KAI4045140.1 zinc finger protein 17 [Homo sapiens]